MWMVEQHRRITQKYVLEAEGIASTGFLVQLWITAFYTVAYTQNRTIQYAAPPIIAAIGMVIIHAVIIRPTSDHRILRRL
jgi:tryptophan-rich sensory protein